MLNNYSDNVWCERFILTENIVSRFFRASFEGSHHDTNTFLWRNVTELSFSYDS